MAGFGGELLFFVALGYVVLGPQRMRTVLHHIARAKQQFEKARADLTTQLEGHCGRERGFAERETAAEIPSAARDPLP